LKKKVAKREEARAATTAVRERVLMTRQPLESVKLQEAFGGDTRQEQTKRGERLSNRGYLENQVCNSQKRRREAEEGEFKKARPRTDKDKAVTLSHADAASNIMALESQKDDAVISFLCGGEEAGARRHELSKVRNDSIESKWLTSDTSITHAHSCRHSNANASAAVASVAALTAMWSNVLLRHTQEDVSVTPPNPKRSRAEAHRKFADYMSGAGFPEGIKAAAHRKLASYLHNLACNKQGMTLNREHLTL